MSKKHTQVSATYVAIILTKVTVFKKETATYVADKSKKAINSFYIAVCFFKLNQQVK